MDISIVNPISGNGKAMSFFRSLKKRLGGIHLFTKHRGHATEFLSDGGYDRVFVFGGDGTLHEVVNGIMRSEQRPEIILAPYGTSNDFARSLRGRGISYSDVWKIELSEKTDYFVNTAGIGFSAEVVRANDGGKTSRWMYALEVLKKIAGWKPRRVRARANRVVDETMFQIEMCNGMYYGPGMKLSPMSRLDDGLLDVVYTRNVGLLDAASLIPAIYTGDHIDGQNIFHEQVRKIEIFTSHGMHADGEFIGEGPSVISHAGKLRIGLISEMHAFQIERPVPVFGFF